MNRASSLPAERAASKLIGVPASAAPVRERPILFSGDMVKAILAGHKTQTRRVIRIDDTPISKAAMESGKRQRGIPSNAQNVRWLGSFLKCDAPAGSATVSSRVECPYGEAGDRLYVRETWQTFTREADGCGGIRFRADEAFVPIQNTRAAADLWIEAHDNGKHANDWRPSIFLPRWASRITLEVTNVRVERLQDLTEEDAKAEGVSAYKSQESWLCIPKKGGAYDVFVKPDPVERGLEFVKHQPSIELGTAHDSFVSLWTEINGKRPGCTWADNPWLWVLDFRRMA